ncbi:TetR/AcrR family transcriptional regulator [Actinocorallia populi]|uniref:TetR/AcrR family transcriptional regulator n=1 Tax=Actinocorallia populi TaxID=2079200 RepID=UPI001E4739F7|nr:TetR family transcriptional regulator C-terminal domain-containing protein [Actinocorallia populi]
MNDGTSRRDPKAHPGRGRRAVPEAGLPRHRPQSDPRRGQGPKGSLYFHFPGGKEQLAVEATAQAADEWGHAIDAVLAEAGDTRSITSDIADLLGAVLLESDFRDSCPLATLALEVAADSDQIRTVCAGGYQRWIDLITVSLRDRGVPEDQTEELATFVLASVEGALLLAKVRRDTAPLQQVAAQLAALIAARIPSEAP